MTANVKELGHLISYKIRMTVLTPVFIGGGEYYNLGKTQYVFEIKGKQKIIHVLDESKWVVFLQENKLFEKYLDFIQRFSKEQKAVKNRKPPQYQGGLYEWLEDAKIPISKYNHCFKYSIDASQVERGHDLHCFVKNHDKLPYIPGSSIKGAIKTAVLFDYLKRNEKRFSHKWDEIKRALESGFKRDLNRIIESISSDVFCTIQYDESRRRLPSATKDIFKGLQVGDSMPMPANSLIALQKLDLSTSKNKMGKNLKPLPLFRECLRPNTETEFRITLDQNIVKGTFIENFDEIRESLLRFHNFLNESEKGIYDKFERLGNISQENQFLYPDQANEEYVPQPYICLGGGAGFLAKTVIHALAPSFKDANRAIKEYLTKSFDVHKHFNDADISPRTLKLARYGNDNFITGWVSLEVADA